MKSTFNKKKKILNVIFFLKNIYIKYKELMNWKKIWKDNNFFAWLMIILFSWYTDSTLYRKRMFKKEKKNKKTTNAFVTIGE